MRAVAIDQYGAPEAVLKVIDVAVPAVGDNQVLVKVTSAAINPVDWKVVSGALVAMLPKTFPHVPGYDLAGVVIQVGGSVKDFKVGDEVYSCVFHSPVVGAFAEYAVVDEFRLAHKPKNLNFDEAAGVPLVALTSYQALKTAGLDENTKPDAKDQPKVLVLGGGGGTGMFGVSLAHLFGAFVASTCSASNFDRVKKFGADQLIDYTKEKWSDVLAGKNFDIVYDTVGEADSYELAQKVLKRGGVFVEIASGGKGVDDFPRKRVLIDSTPGKQQLTLIAKWLEEGKLFAEVEKTYPFTQQGAIDMFKHSQSQRAKGKLVLKIH